MKTIFSCDYLKVHLLQVESVVLFQHILDHLPEFGGRVPDEVKTLQHFCRLTKPDEEQSCSKLLLYISNTPTQNDGLQLSRLENLNCTD